MAIYHTRVKTFSRAQGHSSAAAAAYRAGLLIVDERTGTKHDYRRRGGVVETRCIAPDEAPDWAFVPSQLWAAAEAAERRKDATVAREFEIALPHELNDAQRSALLSALCRGLVERYRFAVQASIHAPDTPDGLNYHAHILATTRRVEEAGLTDKTRELDGGASGRVEVEWTREMVATTINAHLEAAQLEARVDHRSLEAQADAALARGDVAAAVALTRQPTQHVGKNATALDRRGEETERVEVNSQIEHGNEEAFAALLAKYEQDGRAVPTPDGHNHERARRERKRDAAIRLSSVDDGSQIRVVRGLGSTSEDEPKLLSTPDGRRLAAEAAFEEAASLWDEGFIASFDLALKSTAVVIKERATLTATFVSQAPFVVYVRELVRRLKRLKNDVSRLARRKAAAQRAQGLLHQAEQALEQFDSEQPKSIWSRREWSKRRTRRVAAVTLRSKQMAAARKAVGSEAKKAYDEQATASAAALEAWSNDILKRYPLPKTSDGGDVAAPPESDPFTEAAEVPLVLEPETPMRKKRGPAPRLH